MKPSFQFKRFIVHVKQHRFAVAPLLSIFMVFVLFQNCGHQVSNSGGYTGSSTTQGVVLSATPTPQPQALSISPSQATLIAGQTLAFTASGGAEGGYIFSITSGSGSVTSGGVYTAPQTVGVRGASATVQVVDSAGAVARVQISMPGNSVILQEPTLQDVTLIDSALSISPAKVTLSAGQSLAFSASGGSQRGYTFTLVSGQGSVTSTGVYTAPASVGIRGANATLQVTDSAGTVTTARVSISGNSVVIQNPPLQGGVRVDPGSTGAPQDLQPTR